MGRGRQKDMRTKKKPEMAAARSNLRCVLLSIDSSSSCLTLGPQSQELSRTLNIYFLQLKCFLLTPMQLLKTEALNSSEKD